MAKAFSALFLLPVLFTVSRAQPPSAMDQLRSAGPDAPAAPLPARGDQFQGAVHWDPDAPFSYSQNRSLLERPGDGTVVIRNVRYGAVPDDHKSYLWGSYTVRPELVEKAVYAWRTAGTGHTFLVFTFKEGGAVDAGGRSETALTFGAEGWSREPYGYNIYQALAGRYPLIWNVTTFANYAEYIARKDRDTFFKAMNIGPEQARLLFSLLLERIDASNSGGETYDLFNNSCTNNPVALINGVVPEEQRIRLEAAGISTPAGAVPVIAVKKFEKKGVLGKDTSRMGPDNYPGFDITKI